MNTKKIILLSSILLTSFGAFAQYEEDLFRFSGQQNSTSARLSGMGGQQTSLGGDISSLYGNPAGLGMYSSSDFSFSLGFINNKNNATFLNNTNSSSFFNPNITNIGVVFHSPVAKTGNLKNGLLALNFGIGYQKTNFFRNELSFSGTTSANGIGDYFAQDATNFGLNENLVEAAFDAYLFHETTSGNYVDNTQDNASQKQTIDTKGGQSNFDLSLGMNFSNKVYLGFGVGIASINYTSAQLLQEDGYNNDVSYPTPYTASLLKSYDTKGSGFNVKIGAIAKPVDQLRLGFSFESPTWYNLDDNYYEELAIDDNYGRTNGNNSYPVNYNFRTPLKLNGGISYIIGNKGLISADISYRDYSNVNFESDINDISTDINVINAVKSNYTDAVNYGIGGEVKVTPAVAIRAGYRYIADANRDLIRDYSVNKYSGGIGYRFGSYYIDGALSFYKGNSDYAAYTALADHPLAEITNNVTNVSLTFGARF